MIIEKKINDSEYNNFDSIENLPPSIISQLWFEGIPIPSYDESLSIYLAAQYLYSFLELYCPLNNNSQENEITVGYTHEIDNSSPMTIEEANILRNLSISIQIYCERIRLLFFSYSTSSSTISNASYYGHYCQFCGNYEIIPPDNPLKIICSSCTMSIDTCMYTFVPIKLLPTEEDIIKKCLLCSACINSKYMQSQVAGFPWIPSTFSSLLCLFCSSSMVDLFE